MRVIFYTAILCLALLSCTSKQASETFSREEYLRKYLAITNKPDLSAPCYIFILCNNCEDCTNKNKEFVIDYFSENGKKFIYFNKIDRSIINAYKKLPNTTIYQDTANLMVKYGLNTGTDYVFQFDRDELQHWSAIEPGNYNDLMKKFNL